MRKIETEVSFIDGMVKLNGENINILVAYMLITKSIERNTNKDIVKEIQKLGNKYDVLNKDNVDIIGKEIIKILIENEEVE